MKKIHFTTSINAPAEKVWKVLWDDTTYPEWTSVFGPGSSAVSTWNEGDKVHFQSLEGDGLYSIIDKKIPNELMIFIHQGVLKDGAEQPLDEETKKWSGAEEKYTLKSNSDITELTVDMDVTEEFEAYFTMTYPKAIEKIKELSEN